MTRLSTSCKTIMVCISHLFSVTTLCAPNQQLPSIDLQIENLKGDQILARLGRSLRNAIKYDLRTLLFTTTSLSTDGEFLAGLGTIEIKDSKGITKHNSQYAVIWEMEQGKWKMYRDEIL